MPAHLSVVLCTFNGQAFLLQQLASLSAQTRLPDELIVRDDGSFDSTIPILRRFAESAAFPVTIRTNDTRLGAAKNFERAIADCSGDIIVLCDQDDFWATEKLEVVEQAFAVNPALGAFFSDAQMCDARGIDLGYGLWTSVGLTGRLLGHLRNGSAFDAILRQNVVTGATLAFASRFRSLVLPIDPLWMHDGWIALLIAACAPVHADPRPLIRYRQHPNQAVGAARRSLLQQYRNARKMDQTVFAQQADMYQAVLNRLEKFSTFGHELRTPAGCLPGAHLQRLRQKVRHYRIRSAIRLGQQSRLRSSLTEFFSFRYQRFSLGWKSFAQDLFL